MSDAHGRVPVRRVGVWQPSGTGNPLAPHPGTAAKQSAWEAVEIVSTRGQLPSASLASRWLEELPKAWMIHLHAFGIMVKDPAAIDDVTAHGTSAASLRAVFRQFVEGVEPLRRAGRLATVVLAFPQSFSARGEDLRSHLLWLRRCREELSGFQLAMEFADPAWYRGRVGAEMHQFLSDEGISWILRSKDWSKGGACLGPTTPTAHVRTGETEALRPWLSQWRGGLHTIWHLPDRTLTNWEEEYTQRGAN